MTATRSQTGARGGFTLIELLVVITIIGILMALTTAAIFRFIPAQQTDVTRKTIDKVRGALNKQMTAVFTVASKEQIPAANYANLLMLANNDARRARVIWIKLRLKQEFPMTYDEATNPGGSYISPKQSFVTALGGRKSANPPSPAESGACLLIALGADRGNTADTSSVLSAAEVRDSDGDGLKEVVDAWGNPLVFYRWPVDNPDIQPKTSTVNADPQDPDGFLLSGSWPQASVTTFEGLCHSLTDPTSGARSARNYSNGSIVSFGPNGKLGLVFGPGTTPSNFTMKQDNTNDSFDNLYGNLLARFGAKGD